MDLSIIPNIIYTIRQSWPVSENTLHSLANNLKAVHFAKKEKLISEGTCCGYAFFIEKGMTRSYWLADGEEITTSFSTEGNINFSMDEFYYSKPSEEYVEAVEEVEAYAVNIDYLKEILASDIGMANWCRIIHQNEYRRLHRSHKERLTLPAQERYAAFAAQFPDICRRARLSDIASYLGITLSTLSRIRSRGY